MKQLIQIAVTLLLVLVIVIFVDAAYTAIVIGNQLVHASITSIAITIMGYLTPIILAIVALVQTWKWKTKK